LLTGCIIIGKEVISFREGALVSKVEKWSPTHLPSKRNRVLTLHKTNEFRRDDPPLMNKLIETMLSIGAGLTKVDLAGFKWKFAKTKARGQEKSHPQC